MEENERKVVEEIIFVGIKYNIGVTGRKGEIQKTEGNRREDWEIYQNRAARTPQ